MKEVKNQKNRKGKNETTRKKGRKPTEIYQSQVSILGPVGYGPTTLPLRHSDLCDRLTVKIYIYCSGLIVSSMYFLFV